MTIPVWDYKNIPVRNSVIGAPAAQPAALAQPTPPQPDAGPTPNAEEQMQKLMAQPPAVFNHVRSYLRTNGITDVADAMRVVEQTLTATERLREQIRNGENPIAPGLEDIKLALQEEQRRNNPQNNNDPLLLVAAMEQARYFQLEEQRRLNNLRTNPGATPPMNYGSIASEPFVSGNTAEMLDAAFNNVPQVPNLKGGPDRSNNGPNLA